jgi:hypothetical protein
MTHSFRPSPGTSADISLSPSQGLFTPGTWNKVDIMLGDASNNMTQLYGITFDLVFETSHIQHHAAYIEYSNSFLYAVKEASLNISGLKTASIW